MKRLQVRLIFLAAFMLATATFALSWLVLKNFERELPAEMARTVSAVGHSTLAVVKRAYALGIPFEEMPGTETYFASIRKNNPGIDYVALTDYRGKIVYESGYAGLRDKEALQPVFDLSSTDEATRKAGSHFDTAIPLMFRQQHIGTLHLGQPSVIVEQKLRETFYDIVTVLVVGSLAAFELLRFMLAFTVISSAEVFAEFLARIRKGDFSCYLPSRYLGVADPLSDGSNAVISRINQRYQALQIKAQMVTAELRDRIAERLAQYRFHAWGEHRTLFTATLNYIRWPFFLLIFADSLSLSFFPVYAGQFYSPDASIPKSLVIGLPISVFMFMWALSMPWAGMWSDRIGHRRAFAIGAAITTAGLILTSLAQSLYDLLLWRSLTAVGYGLVFITTQSYVTNNTPAAQRTKGMAAFLSSFFAGSLSGAAIGGILADRIGYNGTIFLSGFLSATAAFFVCKFLPYRHAATATPRRMPALRDFRLLLMHKEFAAITFLAAIPAKIALTGFLYYAAPLYLKVLGNSQSSTGRIMMGYGLAIIFLSPLIANLADRVGKLRWFVTTGGFIGALSMFLVYQFDSTIAALISISLLGTAHAIGVSPQLALISDFCKDAVRQVGIGTATGIFRLIERLGNVLGPIIAGILISRFDFKGAFYGIGMLCLVCATCFTVIFFRLDRGTSDPAAATA